VDSKLEPGVRFCPAKPKIECAVPQYQSAMEAISGPAWVWWGSSAAGRLGGLSW